MNRELINKAATVPVSIRLEITDLYNKMKNSYLIDSEKSRAFDLYDIYWNENFEKINRSCSSCFDRVFITFKLWIAEWTKGQ